MIDVITYDDGLPITVIVPHGRNKVRDDFFDGFVFPMIEANEPIEIIVNTDQGSAPKKRNDGFKKSTQPYVLFSDNDIVFPKNYMKTLLDVLQKNPSKGYAYTGYYGIVKDAPNHPIKNNFRIPTIPFNGERLKQGNFISTMALIRRECFFGFDESLKRLQDWDLFLTLLEKGIEGISVNSVEFLAYYLDEGITSNSNNETDAILKVLQKHNLR